MNAPLPNIKDAPRSVPINESEEVQNLRELLREANDELRKWRGCDTSMYEIGAKESLLIHRAIEFYLHSIMAIETSLECDKANGANTIMYRAEVRDLRDKIVSCHSIRIIPDEDQ